MKTTQISLGSSWAIAYSKSVIVYDRPTFSYKRHYMTNLVKDLIPLKRRIK